MNKRLKAGLAASLVVGLVASGASQAGLIDRGGGLIYDTVLNVTWLADANYAQTSGFDANGLMNWTTATTWAANLSYFDSVRNVTYTDWRLPTVTDTGTSGCNDAYTGTDCGYNVDTATGEMAHLWYVDFGNLAPVDTSGNVQAGWGLVNGAAANDESLFTNIQPFYWYGTAYAPTPGSIAWIFITDLGLQTFGPQAGEFFAWAVRPGDVAAAQGVPEPGTLALLGLSLGAMAVARRRRGSFGAS